MRIYLTLFLVISCFVINAQEPGILTKRVKKASRFLLTRGINNSKKVLEDLEGRNKVLSAVLGIREYQHSPLFTEIDQVGSECYHNDYRYNGFIDSLETTLEFISCGFPDGENAFDLKATQKGQINLYGVPWKAFQIVKQIFQLIPTSTFTRKCGRSLGMISQKKLSRLRSYFSARQEKLIRPGRKMRKAISTIIKLRGFDRFNEKNSRMAILFRKPGADNRRERNYQRGIQTREDIADMIGIRYTSGMSRKEVLSAGDIVSTTAHKITLPQKPGLPNSEPQSRQIKPAVNLQSNRGNIQTGGYTTIHLGTGIPVAREFTVSVTGGYGINWGNKLNRMQFASKILTARTSIDYELKSSTSFSIGYQTTFYPGLPSPLGEGKGMKQENLQLGASRCINWRSGFISRAKLHLLYNALSIGNSGKMHKFQMQLGYEF